jgi:hypothetical protein
VAQSQANRRHSHLAVEGPSRSLEELRRVADRRRLAAQQ